jgi:hypothetical protein
MSAPSLVKRTTRIALAPCGSFQAFTDRRAFLPKAVLNGRRPAHWPAQPHRVAWAISLQHDLMLATMRQFSDAIHLDREGRTTLHGPAGHFAIFFQPMTRHAP